MFTFLNTQTRWSGRPNIRSFCCYLIIQTHLPSLIRMSFFKIQIMIWIVVYGCTFNIYVMFYSIKWHRFNINTFCALTMNDVNKKTSPFIHMFIRFSFKFYWQWKVISLQNGFDHIIACKVDFSYDTNIHITTKWLIRKVTL